MLYSISLRPKKLSDVFGQPSIIKELEKRKKSRNWPTAILLKGQSGTGKTTVGQIIAMSINCETPDENGDPCGACASCLSIIEERFDRNTIRIDGGQTSKGEVVDFINTVNISPMYDRKNVVIIEESDQLSKEAKVSLLKALEKPQESTHFILLSMYNTGLPPELQSRCQVYNFKSFTTPDVMYALKGSLERLGLWESEEIPKTFKMEGLRALADSSNGSLRSAIQFLEKCLIGEYWTAEQIRENLGIMNYAQTTNLLKLLLDANPAFLWEFDKIDIQEFFNYSYTILAMSYAHKISSYTNVEERFAETTKALGEHPNLLDLLKVFDELFTAMSYIKKSLMISKFSQYIEMHKTVRKVRKFNE